jgi:uncharacterized iron-regulated membrane protein
MPRRAASGDAAGLYRAVWRWHFYAGLLVLPVLLWLAVTGALYLYKPEIERAVYAPWRHVAATGAVLPLATMTARVAHATGGTVAQVARPADAGDSWRMTVAMPDGARRTAFVDPHDGRVLGTTRQGGVMEVVKQLHSLVIVGPVGNAVIEVAAGWTIVLVATGFWLWWPRGRQPALALRGAPRQRLFWRDLHATTGVIAGAIVLFLAVTGMPWSGVWGAGLQSVVAGSGLGRPPAPVPLHGDHAALPWSMQHAAMPAGGMPRISADAALAVAQGRGIAAPWTMTLPARPGAPFAVSAAIVRAQDAHVVYVDAGSGAVLQDALARDFGAGARAIEWGIAVHQGQEYGEPNRLVMLAGCIAIALLAVSAAVMWWKRRPRGRIGAPPGRSGGGLVAIMAVAGVVFPLTGLTMLAAWAITAIAERRAPA